MSCRRSSFSDNAKTHSRISAILVAARTIIEDGNKEEAREAQAKAKEPATKKILSWIDSEHVNSIGNEKVPPEDEAGVDDDKDWRGDESGCEGISDMSTEESSIPFK